MLTAYRRSIVIIALLCFHTPAGAQEACPDLTQLRAEADAALKKTVGIAGPNRCYAFIDYSVVWTDLKSYAFSHTAPCELSTACLERSFFTASKSGRSA